MILAKQMGVKAAPNLKPMNVAARRALNKVLRDLDDDERSSLALLNAVGVWDWHLVDGTGRVWHFTWRGQTGWNDSSDRTLDEALRRAAELGWEQVEC